VTTTSSRISFAIQKTVTTIFIILRSTTSSKQSRECRINAINNSISGISGINGINSIDRSNSNILLVRCGAVEIMVGMITGAVWL